MIYKQGVAPILIFEKTVIFFAYNCKNLVLNKFTYMYDVNNAQIMSRLVRITERNVTFYQIFQIIFLYNFFSDF